MGVFVFGAIAVIVWLTPAKPRVGPWKLSDGSELSLAGVTHGRTNTMRYGNKFADYLYPILTPALRRKFNCQVATAPNFASNSVVLWFWAKGIGKWPYMPPRGGFPVPSYRPQSGYAIVTVDENGMESAAPLTGQFAWGSGSNLLESQVLLDYPRRSREIKVRIYEKSMQNGLGTNLGEFTIPNPFPTNYPVWEAKTAPVSIEANGLNISVTKFETGIPAGKEFMAGQQAKFLTHAEMIVSNSQGPLEWHVRTAQARSATGENRYTGARTRTYSRYDLDPPLKNASRTVLDFSGTCWLQESAWKLILELERVTNFPPEEVWTIKNVKIPEWNAVNELDLKTNIGGTTIEFLGLSSANSSWGGMRNIPSSPPDHEILVRNPLRSSDAHLSIASVQDDQGRKVDFRIHTSDVYMGGSYSNNPGLTQCFELTIPDGAKSVDVNLAFPKSRFVELLARPTKFGDSQ